MKYLILLITSLLILTSCNPNSNKEDAIISYLNNNEREFDKTKFELVEIKQLDTVFALDDLALNYYYTGSGYIDTTSMSINAPIKFESKKDTIDWSKETFSNRIYSLINLYDDYLLNNGQSILFLNSIVSSNYDTFKKSLLYDKIFQNKLIEEFQTYETFQYISEPKVILDYIKTEVKKSKEVYGIKHLVKFRVNHKLKEKMFVFDKRLNIIKEIKL